MPSSKLTPAIQAAICKAVAAGVRVSEASRLAGVSPVTVRQWVARGEGRSAGRRTIKIYADFAAAINRAKAQDEARRVARIDQAGRGDLVLRRTITETVDKDGKVTKRVIEEHRTAPDWRADAWHLERSRPETWGPKARVHLDAELRAKVQTYPVTDPGSSPRGRRG
jgi:hypothetical protein